MCRGGRLCDHVAWGTRTQASRGLAGGGGGGKYSLGSLGERQREGAPTCCPLPGEAGGNLPPLYALHPPPLHAHACAHWCSIWKLRCPLNQSLKKDCSTLQVAASCWGEVG